MKSKKQSISNILDNANDSICQAYLNSGIPENSHQNIRWDIETTGEKVTYSICDELDKILSTMCGSDSYSISVVPSGYGEFTVCVDTTDFAFDFQNVNEFSKKLFYLAERNGCEYIFWEIEINTSVTI